MIGYCTVSTNALDTVWGGRLPTCIPLPTLIRMESPCKCKQSFNCTGATRYAARPRHRTSIERHARARGVRLWCGERASPSRQVAKQWWNTSTRAPTSRHGIDVATTQAGCRSLLLEAWNLSAARASVIKLFVVLVDRREISEYQSQRNL